jgi:hypothetical protein
LNLIGSTFAWANPNYQKGDSSVTEIVEFDQSIIESYQTDDNYNYFKNNQETSAWKKFKRWLDLQWSKFMEWLFSDITEGNFWNYLAVVLKILLILGLLVLVAWLFNKYYITTRKTPPANQADINLSEDEQLLQKKDLSSLINDAERQGNFRLATRYLFLNLLKHLKEKGLIDYQFEKTNADYKSEIKTNPLSLDFEYASRFYEYVWYGDFTLEVEDFKTAKTRFENVIANLQTTEANG